jgi:hypothetical protein
VGEIASIGEIAGLSIGKQVKWIEETVTMLPCTIVTIQPRVCSFSAHLWCSGIFGHGSGSAGWHTFSAAMDSAEDADPTARYPRGFCEPQVNANALEQLSADEGIAVTVGLTSTFRCEVTPSLDSIRFNSTILEGR